MSSSFIFKFNFLPPSWNVCTRNFLKGGIHFRAKTDIYKTFLRDFEKSFSSASVKNLVKSNFVRDSSIPLVIDVSFYSPRWITKGGGLRVVDLDNRLKALLDAIDKTLGIKDHRYFKISLAKETGRRDETAVEISTFSRNNFLKGKC